MIPRATRIVLVWRIRPVATGRPSCRSTQASLCRCAAPLDDRVGWGSSFLWRDGGQPVSAISVLPRRTTTRSGRASDRALAPRQTEQRESALGPLVSGGSERAATPKGASRGASHARGGRRARAPLLRGMRPVKRRDGLRHSDRYGPPMARRRRPTTPGLAGAAAKRLTATSADGCPITAYEEGSGPVTVIVVGGGLDDGRGYVRLAARLTSATRVVRLTRRGYRTDVARW